MDLYPVGVLSNAMLTLGSQVEEIPNYFERPPAERLAFLETVRTTTAAIRDGLAVAPDLRSAFFQSRCLFVSLSKDIADAQAFLPVKMNRMQLEIAIMEDLLQLTFLRLSPYEAKLYECDAIFVSAPEIHAAFKSANPDLKEAGTCLALGRGTASVFHLMRALSVVLKALARHLGCSKAFSDLRQEGEVVAEIQKRIEARIARLKPSKKKRAKSMARFEQFREVSLHLELVKDAWRNGSFHGRRSYAPHEALFIMKAVETLMASAARAGLSDGN